MGCVVPLGMAMKTVSARLAGFGAVVVVASAMAVWTASPSAAQTARVCDGVQATIVGTSGDDHLVGTDGPDVIAALQGNDTIFGLGGDDIICGGIGDDIILGGEGFDILFGAQGDDVLYSVDGTSEGLRQDTRGARMFGGQGDDELYGSARWDRIQGGLGDDLIVSFEGRDWIRSGAGHDSIDGGAGIDDIRTSSGRDLIDVTVNDLVRAGIGADTCNLLGEATQLWSCETQQPGTAYSDADVRPETTAAPAATEVTADQYGRVNSVQGTYWLTWATPRFGSELQPMVADSMVAFSFKGNNISVDPGVGCTVLNGEFSFNDDLDIDVTELEVATPDCDDTDEERSQIEFLLAVLESPFSLSEAQSGLDLRSDGGRVVLVNRPTAVTQATLGDIHGAYLSTDVRYRDGRPRPLIADSPLSLRFFGNGISIFPGVGCNSSSGDLYVSDQDLLILPGLYTTLVGCDLTDEEWEQRSFVFSFIRSSPKIEISGDTITLSNDEFVIELTDVDALFEDGPLLGTIWEHNHFETETSISSSIDQEGAFVQFIDETTAVGFDGCREFTLAVTIGPASVIEMPEGSRGITGELSFTAPPEPHPPCGSGRPDTDVVPTLLAATTYFVDGDSLDISNDDGHGSRFLAAE